MNTSPVGLTRPALVLSGGGVRGSYEVGVVLGLTEVLGLKPGDASPFGMFSGTSVGAINAAFLAANTHRGDLNVNKLADVWLGLKLNRHLQFDILGTLGIRRRLRFFQKRDSLGRRRSVLDSRPLESLVQETIPWNLLRENIARGNTAALFVTALHIATGRTTIFAELAKGVNFVPPDDPRREAKNAHITANHVLASAALPMMFPARHIDGRFYADGGLRFNTPIAPVLRTGVGKLMVITLMHQPQTPVLLEEEVTEAYPNPVFLAGKLLNALLLDPIMYDLAVLERFNKLLSILNEAVDPDESERIQGLLKKSRGTPYRVVDTLVFSPSVDIGLMASTHIRNNLKSWRLNSLSGWVLGRIGRAESKWESDLGSYVLFDGDFSAKLIELGRRDAHAKADEIEAFFTR